MTWFNFPFVIFPLLQPFIVHSIPGFVLALVIGHAD